MNIDTLILNEIKIYDFNKKCYPLYKALLGYFDRWDKNPTFSLRPVPLGKRLNIINLFPDEVKQFFDNREDIMSGFTNFCIKFGYGKGEASVYVNKDNYLSEPVVIRLNIIDKDRLKLSNVYAGTVKHYLYLYFTSFVHEMMHAYKQITYQERGYTNKEKGKLANATRYSMPWDAIHHNIPIEVQNIVGDTLLRFIKQQYFFDKGYQGEEGVSGIEHWFIEQQMKEIPFARWADLFISVIDKDTKKYMKEFINWYNNQGYDIQIMNDKNRKLAFKIIYKYFIMNAIGSLFTHPKVGPGLWQNPVVAMMTNEQEAALKAKVKAHYQINNPSRTKQK